MPSCSYRDCSGSKAAQEAEVSAEFQREIRSSSEPGSSQQNCGFRTQCSTPACASCLARRAAVVIGLAVAYFVAGRLALLLAIPPGYATAVWPAAGIALAGLVLFGARAWPGIWLGSFLINVWTSLDLANTASIFTSVLLATCLGVGASFQALAGAALMRWFLDCSQGFKRENDVLKFLLVGPLSCVVSATFGVTALRLAGAIEGENYLFSWCTWWIGDTIGVLIFTPLILIWFDQEGVAIAPPRSEPGEVEKIVQLSPRAARRRRQIIITLPLVITFASVVVLFIYASGWEENRLKLEFEHRTDNLAQRLTKTFVGYLDVLHSVENFFASTASVERNEFQTFAQRLISRHPGILAISWNIRVPDSERTNFEQAARADGSVNFQLTEMGPARELVPANRRGEYVPVYFLEPREANERALGFDTASDPLRGEALARARDTGEAAATGPITLVQETGREIGCVVYLPVYENDLPHDTLEQRRQHLRGYAAEVFRIADMMERSLHGLERSGLQIRLSDQSAPEREQLLFGPPEGVHPAQKPAFQRVTPLPMAGRDWSLQFAVRPEYLVAHRSWQAWTVLTAGLLFTAVLGALLLVVTGRTARIEEVVARRTSELQRVNKDLHHEIVERQRAEELIKASLQEKEVMLREIHHRVRNNLQVVLSMLRLQAGFAKDRETEARIEESEHRVKTMVLVHEQLYEADNLSRIDFAQYARNLVAYLVRSLRPEGPAILCRIEIDNVILGIDAAIRCGLILNELSSNSLKHAFPEGRCGEIVIEMRRGADASYRLRVADNGIGLPKGFDFPEANSLGLQLVRTLAQYLKGEIEVHNGIGTEFILTFSDQKNS